MSPLKLLTMASGIVCLALGATGAAAGPITANPPGNPAPPPPDKPTDVPAPSVALLFGLGAAGLFVGRKLGSRGHKS